MMLLSSCKRLTVQFNNYGLSPIHTTNKQTAEQFIHFPANLLPDVFCRFPTYVTPVPSIAQSARTSEVIHSIKTGTTVFASYIDAIIDI